MTDEGMTPEEALAILVRHSKESGLSLSCAHDCLCGWCGEGRDAEAVIRRALSAFKVEVAFAEHLKEQVLLHQRCLGAADRRIAELERLVAEPKGRVRAKGRGATEKELSDVGCYSAMEEVTRNYVRSGQWRRP